MSTSRQVLVSFSEDTQRLCVCTYDLSFLILCGIIELKASCPGIFGFCSTSRARLLRRSSPDSRTTRYGPSGASGTLMASVFVDLSLYPCHQPVGLSPIHHHGLRTGGPDRWI